MPSPIQDSFGAPESRNRSFFPPPRRFLRAGAVPIAPGFGACASVAAAAAAGGRLTTSIT
jgi:hypothetical protein